VGDQTVVRRTETAAVNPIASGLKHKGDQPPDCPLAVCVGDEFGHVRIGAASVSIRRPWAAGEAHSALKAAGEAIAESANHVSGCVSADH
jgi:hypothetical protein